MKAAKISFLAAAFLIAGYLFSQSSMGGGVNYPNIVKKLDISGQTATINPTLLYSVPATGTGYYRICGYIVETTAATTSTLPNVVVQYTDNETNTLSAQVWISNSNTANSVPATSGAPAGNCMMFAPKPGTNINYGSASYASSPAATMVYSLHVRLEYLGL